jgi:hypothetical protein
MMSDLAGPAVVVVPCSGSKLWHAAPAGELYTGSFHKLARRAGDAIVEQHGGVVVVLSALHGLLGLDELVQPYDLSIGQPGAVQAPTVALQLYRLLRQVGGDQLPGVVCLLPRAYRAVLAAAVDELPADARPVLYEPLRGASGVGYQRQRLAQLRTGELTVAS